MVRGGGRMQEGGISMSTDVNGDLMPDEGSPWAAQAQHFTEPADATHPEPALDGTVVPEAPAEQTAPFSPPWLGGDPERPSLTVVTVVQQAPPQQPQGTHRRCPCGFCEPPSTPPRHPYAIWDSTGGIGIQACADCGQVYADEPARSEDHLLGQSVRAAQLAGWRGDALRAWRCPSCTAAHQAALDAAPKLPDSGPGTELYEAWLGLHLACLKDIDEGIATAGGTVPDAVDALVEEVQLRTVDIAVAYAIGKDEAKNRALAAAAESRAAA